jgi:endonuclease YncB( thermonuclease family)
MKSIKVKIFVVFLFLSISSLSLSQIISGKVVKIIDGDTFLLKSNDGIFKIRLYGVDAPELDQYYGKEAKRLIENLSYEKQVTAYVRYNDPYGRLVGKVILDDGSVLNEILIVNGAVWWYRHYSKNEKVFQVLEEYAQKNKIGLWEQENPVAPWVYRKNK